MGLKELHPFPRVRIHRRRQEHLDVLRQLSLRHPPRPFLASGYARLPGAGFQYTGLPRASPPDSSRVIARKGYRGLAVEGGSF